MKNNLKQINKIKNDIVDCEMHLAILEEELCEINHNFQVLRSEERELRENISFLKKKQIIAIAKEYKKSTDRLMQVVKKLNLLDHQYKFNLKEFGNSQRELDKLKSSYEKYIKTTVKQNKVVHLRIVKQNEK